MRMRDDNSLEATELLNASNCVVIDIGDAIPEHVTCVTAKKECALPNCECGSVEMLMIPEWYLS